MSARDDRSSAGATIAPFARTPALDGLRGVAVAAVFLYHLKTKAWFPGGFMGVDVFFVLSGFLITRLLLDEHRLSGAIALPRFYGRRALRLLPAAFAFFAAYAIVFTGASLLDVRDYRATWPIESVGYAAGYAINWAGVLHRPISPAFSHVWSLSVEEQFYFTWPLALWLLLRAGARPGDLLGPTIALAIVAAGLPHVFRDSSWQRWYYGTDFRAHQLLLGAAIALASVSIVSFEQFARSTVVRAAALAGTAIFVAILFLPDGHERWTYLYGHQLVALSSAAVVTVCAFGGAGVFGRLLASWPMEYAGRRSYAIYLWQLPVAYWLLDAPWPLQAAVAVPVTLALAEASYRLIERPALRRKERLRPEALARAIEPATAPA